MMTGHHFLQLILCSLALSCLIGTSRAKCWISLPDKTLSELHRGCNTDKKSRHPDCVSAMHRFCNKIHYPIYIPTTLGVSREHLNGRIGMSCVKTHWGGHVSIHKLKLLDGGCKRTYLSQGRSCIKATHRFCKKRFGPQFAGISQEVSPKLLQVHCFKATLKYRVKRSELRRLVPSCRFMDSSTCFSAASRWCEKYGFPGGIPQESNHYSMEIYCYKAEFFGDVFTAKK